jgi:integrase
MAGKKKGRRPKGDGGFTERSDGTWMFSIETGPAETVISRETGEPALSKKTGKPLVRRKRRVVYAKTKAALVAKVQDLRARGGGSITPRADGTLASWISTWLDECKSNVSENVERNYRGIWENHVAPVLGAVKLDRFDIEDVERLYTTLRAKGMSAAMLNRVGVVMGGAINVAIRRQRYRKANPFTLVAKPRVPKAQTRILEPDEVRAFLKAAEGDRFESLWIMLVLTGLRLGEALGLKWGDVDLKKLTIGVRRSLIEVGGKLKIGATKNQSSRRLVTIGALGATTLKSRRRVAESEGHAAEDDFIFATVLGRPMERSNLRRSHFEPIVARTKLGHLRIHDLRHASASLALTQGVPLKVVAERLGHATVRMTADRYSHVIGELQAAAAGQIEAALEKPKTPRRKSRNTK